MANSRRRRLLIDGPVQLGLFRRLALYAVYCLITATLLVFFWRVITMPFQRPHEHLLSAIGSSAPLLLALACILSFVAYDLLKLTNHFVGPIYRLRCTLASLERGETIRPIKFREGDYWCELAGQLNLLAARLGQLESSPSSPRRQPHRRRRPPNEPTSHSAAGCHERPARKDQTFPRLGRRPNGH
jgi:hypothetical protein